MDAAVAMMIAVSGASIWAGAAGTGPAVVFLHAGVADSRMWDAEFTALRATHRVVRLDPDREPHSHRTPLPDPGK